MNNQETEEDKKIAGKQPDDDLLSDNWAALDNDRTVSCYITWAGGDPCPDNLYRVTNGQYRLIEHLRWAKRLNVHISKEGVITTSIPPQPLLKDQAKSALKDIESQAAIIVAMGESFGPETQAYVKTLKAIINGTDTTSTELPAKPDNLTD